MKRLVLVSLLMILVSSVFAHDKIVRINGTKIYCDIVHIDSNQVELDYFNNGTKARTFIALDQIESIKIGKRVFYQDTFPELYNKSFHKSTSEDGTVDTGISAIESFNGFFIRPNVGVGVLRDELNSLGLEIGYLGSGYSVGLDYYAWAGFQSVVRGRYPSYWSNPSEQISILFGKYYTSKNARFELKAGPGYLLSSDDFVAALKVGPRLMIGNVAALGIDFTAIICSSSSIGLDFTLEFGKLR